MGKIVRAFVARRDRLLASNQVYVGSNPTGRAMNYREEYQIGFGK